MLKKIRVVLALVFWACITLLFLDFTGTLRHYVGWMAKIQFLPAVLALNIGVIIGLVALTLIFGRIYCSVICPLGVMQDAFAWLGRRGKKKRNKYAYSKAISWLRYSVLALFVLAIIFGINWFVAILAPYSAYGRIVSNLIAPVTVWANNYAAGVAEGMDSYAFHVVDLLHRNIFTTSIAAVTLIALAILAWRNGRTYCNTICPVGTVLGFLSKYSWLKPVIDTSKCVNCSICARRCKAACIDYKNHEIDYSRCVTCMDCLNNCTHGAISYKHPEKKAESKAEESVDATRRAFVSGLGVIAASAATLKAQKTVDGGLAAIEDKKIPNRATRIVPPGAVSLANVENHCTACQLCITNCPNGVLRPSENLETLMMPESSYEIGYCRPECTRCSDLCPTGAIVKIDKAEKSAIQIGHAVWIKENCIPVVNGDSCGNCARHCPTGAIKMFNLDPNDPESPLVPAVNEALCIGCGACENLCPARPFSAIYVEGHQVHRHI